MHIYIYVYIYIHIHIYIHTFICIYIYIYTYTHIRIYRYIVYSSEPLHVHGINNPCFLLASIIAMSCVLHTFPVAIASHALSSSCRTVFAQVRVSCLLIVPPVCVCSSFSLFMRGEAIEKMRSCGYYCEDMRQSSSSCKLARLKWLSLFVHCDSALLEFKLHNRLCLSSRTPCEINVWKGTSYSTEQACGLSPPCTAELCIPELWRTVLAVLMPAASFPNLCSCFSGAGVAPPMSRG